MNKSDITWVYDNILSVRYVTRYMNSNTSKYSMNIAINYYTSGAQHQTEMVDSETRNKYYDIIKELIKCARLPEN